MPSGIPAHPHHNGVTKVPLCFANTNQITEQLSGDDVALLSRLPADGPRRAGGVLASGAAKTHCISTHVMMRTARATMETTTKAVMACFFWLAATTARRSACSQRAPTYPEWQLRKTGMSAHSPGRSLILPTPQEGWAGGTQTQRGSSSLCSWR